MSAREARLASRTWLQGCELVSQGHATQGAVARFCIVLSRFPCVFVYSLSGIFASVLPYSHAFPSILATLSASR